MAVSEEEEPLDLRSKVKELEALVANLQGQNEVLSLEWATVSYFVLLPKLCKFVFA